MSFFFLRAFVASLILFLLKNCEASKGLDLPKKIIETKNVEGRLEVVAMDFFSVGKKYSFCAFIPKVRNGGESLYVIDNIHNADCHNGVSLQVQLAVHGRPFGEKQHTAEQQRAYEHPAGAKHAPEPMNYVHGSIRSVLSVEGRNLKVESTTAPESQQLKQQLALVKEASVEMKKTTEEKRTYRLRASRGDGERRKLAKTSGESALLVVRVMLDNDSPNSGNVDGYCDADCASDNAWGDDSARVSYLESSYGNLDISASAGDLVSIALDTKPSDYDGCDFTGLGEDTLNYLIQLNVVNVFSYDMVTFYMSQNIDGCGFEGVAFVGGVYSWERNDWVGVLTHELGHSLSAWHASTDEGNDGVKDCEYCDHSGIMGNSFTRHVTMTAPHRDMLGWIPSDAKETLVLPCASAPCTVQYTLQDLQTDPADLIGDELLLLKIPRVYRTPSDVSGHYFVSYRAGTGLDSALSSDYIDQVSLHYYMGQGYDTFFITALDEGDEYSDTCKVQQVNTEFFSISVVSISGGTAVVEVTTGTVAEPTDCFDVIVEMKDSFGDGWEGGALYFDNTQCKAAGLESGSSGSQTVCLPNGTYTPFACDSYAPSEIAWSIYYTEDGELKVLKGTADNSCDTDYGSFTVTESTSSSSDDDDDDNFNDDDDNGGKVNVCFAGDQTVLLNSGAEAAIADVVVGDSIQVMRADASLAFADVVFVPHRSNDIAASFVQLETAAGRTLKATPQHLVRSSSCNGVFDLLPMERIAADVATGGEGQRCVSTVDGEELVVRADMLTGRGVYSVVTADTHGHVVVNGVVASSFGTIHAAPNAYYNLHRALYAYVLPAWVLDLHWSKAANMLIGGIGISIAAPFMSYFNSK